MFFAIGRWSASGGVAFDAETDGEGELGVEGLDGCDGATSCVVEYLTGSDGGRAGGEGKGGGTAALGAGTIGAGFVSCVRNNDEMGSMGTRGSID
jgi:hypothetical protein